MHYDNLFVKVFKQSGHRVIYQPTCLQIPHDAENGWRLVFPTGFEWTDDTVVVMHTQDFVTINSKGQCPEAIAIEEHFGSRANQVVIIHWNYDLQTVYSGPCRLIHFPTHSYEIIQRLQNPPYENWRQEFQKERTRNWQCLNGVARPHRICVHDILKTYPNGISSLANIDPLPQDPYHVAYRWQPGEHDLNESNFMRLNWLYSTTKINVVTETQYHEVPGIITEKTLFALLAGQIPIVIGYAGIVDHCRRLGFDMFDDLVDTSYDYLPDEIRYRRAIELNQELLINTPDLSAYQTRLKQQQDFLITKWNDILVERLQQQASNYLATL